jgi:DNA mismatch repair ATPase MutS
MKAFLMYRDRDFSLEQELPANEDALTQDLELETLLHAMAAGDQFLWDMARKAVLCSLTDPAEITYRQAILADCLEHPDVVREMYQIALDAILGEKRVFFGLFRDSPETILYRSQQVLELFVSQLRKLRQVAGTHAAAFQSEGFTRFFGMLAKELDDAYLQEVEDHLKELAFKRGVLISAGLGKGNKGANYVLRRQRDQGWKDRIPGVSRQGYSFYVPERDEGGFKALSDLRSRGLNLVANAAAQSSDHILSFFTMLRAELGFYIGCLNLRDRLAERAGPTCFPEPVPAEPYALRGRGLYDVCLALTTSEQVVGNDVAADGKRLVVITGANQGGKSTFLRSVGLAHLMMQCGMFVPAGSMRASVCTGVFTHDKREEDATMTSGKFDEELSRMSDIAGLIERDCLLLCNESFASTNEREGSEIARQIVHALVEAGVRVFFVTHLFDLAHGLYLEGSDSTLFLRAERRSDGTRTFRLPEGKPLPTSFGEDLYKRIFGADSAAASAQPTAGQPG